MKKGLLVLATLLLISCVNLNEHKGERVIVNTKSSGYKRIIRKKIPLLIILKLLRPEIY